MEVSLLWEEDDEEDLMVSRSLWSGSGWEAGGKNPDDDRTKLEMSLPGMVTFLKERESRRH